jgi:hypothetical protein
MPGFFKAVTRAGVTITRLTLARVIGGCSIGQPDENGYLVTRNVGDFLFTCRLEKGSGTVVRSTLRAVPATVPDPNGTRLSESSRQ